MPHKIIMDDEGIVHIHLSGSLDSHDAFSFRKDVDAYLQAASPDLPLMVLTTSNPDTSFEYTMRKSFTAFCQDPRIRKAGFVNSSPSLRVLSIFLSQKNGTDHILLFENETLARQWLRKSD